MAENNTTQIFTIKIDYQELEKYKEVIEQVLGTYDENISKLAKVNEQIKANNAAIASLNKEDADYKQTLDALTKEHIQLTTRKSELLKIIKNEEKLTQSANGTYEHANATLNKLTIAYKRMTEEQQKAHSELPKKINDLREQLKQADATMGNFQRNVGNYGSAWNGLQLQVQQVARELPSLTMGANQFFLAISNNLPMLVDEMKRASQANAEMRAQGEATVPVWKQMISSIFSWQTALVVGITLLSAYGKDIAAWAKELINGKDAVDYLAKSLGGLTGSIMQERLQLDAMFSALRNAKEGTTEYEIARRNILDKYGSYLENQREEVKNLTDLEAAYKTLSNAMTAKAIKEGMMQQITEASKEAGEKIQKYADNLRSLFDRALPVKGYTKEQIDNLFNEYISGITSNEPELKARAEEIKGLFDYIDISPVSQQGELENLIKRPTKRFNAALSEFQSQTDAITKSGQIMASAFNVDITALDNLTQATKDAVAQRMDEWIERQSAAGDTLTQKLTSLRLEYKKLRDEAIKAGFDTAELDKAFAKRRAEIVNETKNLTQATKDAVAQRMDEWMDKQSAAGDALAKQLTSLRLEYEKLRDEAIKAGLDTSELDQAYRDRYTEILNKSVDMNLKPIKLNFKFDVPAMIQELKDSLKESEKEIEDATANGDLQIIKIGLDEKEKEQVINSAVSTAGQIFSTIEQMQQESIQRRMQDELDALNRETDSKKQALKAQRENGIISQKAYERKLAQIDKEAAARQEEIKKAAFEKQKKWNILQAVMNGAVAITNILSQHAANPIMLAILTALAVAMTAAQVATISAQKYARGGLLRGRSHSQGGIRGQIDGNPIEVEGDEVIINKRSARVFRNELSAINSYNGWGNPFPNAGRPRFIRDMKFARGGVLAGYNFAPAPLPMSAASVSTARTIQQDKQILRYVSMLIDGRIAQIRATVLYHDIEEIEDELRINVSRASM